MMRCREWSAILSCVTIYTLATTEATKKVASIAKNRYIECGRKPRKASLLNEKHAFPLRRIIIAIDGPAASGKSTTARLVAKQLGFLYVDTGAMYRAVALKVLERGFDVSDAESVSQLVEKTEVRLVQSKEGLRVFLDGRDVTEKIRKPEVSDAASAVSAIPKVREVLVREQRKMGESGGIVVDGRDIGTVVFPDADLKIYMVADVEERAKRRQRELLQKGGARAPDLNVLMQDIQERDKRDSSRALSPLKKAVSAIELDTTNLTIEGQVEFVLREAGKLIQRT